MEETDSPGIKYTQENAITSVETTISRCSVCHAPVLFQPGTGARRCAFCERISIVREQRISVPAAELMIDEVFHRFQKQQYEEALAMIRQVDQGENSPRLIFYRACILLAMDKTKDASYLLIDLIGMDSSRELRADVNAKLAEALLRTNRFDEAIQAGQRGLKLVPGHPSCQLVMAQILAASNRLVEAIERLEKLIPILDKPMKVSFPPSRPRTMLFAAQLLYRNGEIQKACSWVETLLHQETAAPIALVLATIGLYAQILCDLQTNPMSASKDPQGSQSHDSEVFALLARLTSQLGPNDEPSLQEILSKVPKPHISMVLPDIGTQRAENSKNLREVLGAMVGWTGDLWDLGADPDSRCDQLERAARDLRVFRFDRGTLYPLRTSQDFARWIACWKFREGFFQIKKSIDDANRLEQLRQIHAKERQLKKTSTSTLPIKKSKRSTQWIVVGLVLSLVAILGVFVAVAGDRFLDEFQGRLIRIDCLGENGTGPCMLYMDGGKPAQERYLTNTTTKGWRSWFHRWLDKRVSSDGTIIYPLSFPWGDIKFEIYNACIGKEIVKSSFSLTPECTDR